MPLRRSGLRVGSPLSLGEALRSQPRARDRSAAPPRQWPPLPHHHRQAVTRFGASTSRRGWRSLASALSTRSMSRAGVIIRGRQTCRSHLTLQPLTPRLEFFAPLSRPVTAAGGRPVTFCLYFPITPPEKSNPPFWPK